MAPLSADESPADEDEPPWEPQPATKLATTHQARAETGASDLDFISRLAMRSASAVRTPKTHPRERLRLDETGAELEHQRSLAAGPGAHQSRHGEPSPDCRATALSSW
jgi:hypothetical protein